MQQNNGSYVLLSLYVLAGILSLSIGLFGFDVAREYRLSFNFLFVQQNSPDWLLRSHEITNPSRVSEIIRESDDSLSNILKTELGNQILDALADHRSSDTEYHNAILANKLNELLVSGRLISVQAFEELGIVAYDRPKVLSPLEISTQDRISLSRFLLSSRFPDEFKNDKLSRWDYWGVSAIVLTLFYAILFWIDGYYNVGRPAIFAGLTVSAISLINLMYAMSLATLLLCLYAIVNHLPVAKLWALLGYFSAWMFIDIYIAKRHTKAAVKKEFKDLFFIIDAPFFAAIVVLLLFSYVVADQAAIWHDFEVFVSGAIAFKIVLQNANFLILTYIRPLLQR